MKPEKFLTALNMIDERYLDVETHGDAQSEQLPPLEYGSVKSTASDRKKPVLLRALPALCGTAACIAGGILLLKHFTPQPYTYMQTGTQLWQDAEPQTAESLQKVYQNLDLTNTQYSIPSNQTYDRLRFPIERFNVDAETGKKILSEAYAGFFGEEPAGGEWSAITSKNHDTVIVPLSELAGNDLQYLIYRNLNCYMDIMWANKLEGYRITDTAAYAGKTGEYKASWRPSFTGELVRTCKAGEDVSYPLCGKDVSLSEAFQTAKAFFERKDLGRVNSDLFTYEPVSADVYRFENNNYGYTVSLDILYDGVKVCTEEGWTDEETNPASGADFCGKLANIITMSQQCFIGCPDRVDWFWSAALNAPAGNDRTTYSVSDLLSKEDALEIVDEIVSKKKSADTTYSVSEIALEYMFCEVRNEKEGLPCETVVEPSWRIQLNVPSSLYEQVIFDISAVTGDVIVRHK